MGKSKQILLVFSDLKTAEIINKHILTPAGHDVNITTNQKKAKNIVEFKCPNLLILSDKEEGLDSIELINYFLKEEPTLPIIYLSNKSSVIRMENFISKGYVDVIDPPFEQKKIQNAISLGLKRNENWLNWLTNDSNSSKGKTSTLILENIENGVVAYDKQGKITFLNQVVMEALNLPIGGQVGKSIEDVFLDPDWMDIFNGDHSATEILEVTGANGKIFQVGFSQNQKDGKTVSFSDITKLKELHDLKTDYVNTISHDLRSPLTSIFGYIDLIQRSGKLNEEQQEYIGKINISAHTINSLIDDILNLGNAENIKIPEMEMLAIYPIIQESIDDLLVQANARNQTLTFTYDEELPDIPGDPIQLRHIFDNLIGNAIKYTQKGGAIEVLAKCKREIVTIKIKDNGSGIPKEEFIKIFEKFYRSKYVNPTAPGTGLGLAIVKSAVDNHHGRIKIESELGKGTTFKILLPAFS